LAGLIGFSGWLGRGFRPLARQLVENAHDYKGCSCGGCEDSHQSISVTANIHAILSAALRSPSSPRVGGAFRFLGPTGRYDGAPNEMAQGPIFDVPPTLLARADEEIE
jgi:hypothetical protein